MQCGSESCCSGRVCATALEKGLTGCCTVQRLRMLRRCMHSKLMAQMLLLLYVSRCWLCLCRVRGVLPFSKVAEGTCKRHDLQCGAAEEPVSAVHVTAKQRTQETVRTLPTT